tara:strand:+ start:700 stop:1083 length:384 start_codon:yes stop_codon:yes gene_type:complete
MSEENKNILDDLYRKIIRIENSIESVKHHPSQNGGWLQMMGLIEKIDKRLEALEESLNDPRSGAIAEVTSLREWRERVELILQEYQQSSKKVVKMEMQLSAYNKITWAIGAAVVGLLTKAIMSLIII